MIPLAVVDAMVLVAVAIVLGWFAVSALVALVVVAALKDHLGD